MVQDPLLWEGAVTSSILGVPRNVVPLLKCVVTIVSQALLLSVYHGGSLE